jgi:single-strand DNA-binding protein
MFQKVTLIGNLGSDPETRYTQSGTSVCSFSVATNRKWTNGDGTPGEETVWWRVSAWGKLGEICQQYLAKGRQVFLEGEMVPDRETGGPRLWTDQNGQSRASFELRANTMKMIGGRDEAGSNQYDNNDYQEPQRQQAQRPAAAPSGQGKAAPQQRPAPAQAAQRPAPAAGGARRTTASQPQTQTYDYDEIDPDEIPF